MAKKHITAKMILDLLTAKHNKDVFVPECKDGPTWVGKHYRLDAWSMKRSWSRFSTIGYEIKVSRSDFLGDTKFMEYMPLCHELYIVAPTGVCLIEELPEGVGLIVPSTNCTRLYMKRRAQHHEPTDLWQLLAYILMSRAEIKQSGYYAKESNAEFWRSWLETKEINSSLGYRVSQELRKTIDEKIDSVKRANEILQKENDRLSEIKRILDSYGITSRSTWSVELELRRRVEEIERGYSNEVLGNLNTAINALTRLKQELDK